MFAYSIRECLYKLNTNIYNYKKTKISYSNTARYLQLVLQTVIFMRILIAIVTPMMRRTMKMAKMRYAISMYLSSITEY